MATAEHRRRRLLAVVRREGGSWTTRRCMELYRALGWGCQRSTSRHDLQLCARRGDLIEHGPVNGRWYTANTATRTWGGAAR
ncbi:hypothetical protein [Streptomyces luteireticuli]|uniref:hypothetical protein n=1 Tax=Streptomyces luteireticuli TaxID=173858 RepID=UPI0035564227